LTKSSLLNQLEKQDGISNLIAQVSLPTAQALKDLSFELKNQVPELFGVFAADINGKPQIAVIISDGLVDQYGLNAGNLVRELAKAISGGGGGQPFFATAGGKDIEGLPKVVEQARKMFSGFILQKKQNS
jgi:alanyl-tRNA synthetase